RRLAQPVGRNDVTWKWRSIASGIVAGSRIIDGGQAIEVGATNLSSRNAQYPVAAFRGCRALPRREEKQLVAPDRSANSAAKLVVDALGCFGAGRRIRVEKQVLRAPITVRVILERHGVPLVRAGFRHDRNCGA